MGLDFPDDGRAVGICDWDNDGDADLWLANRTGPRLRLMRNQSADRDTDTHRALQLQLVGTSSNRDAIGARVTLSLRPSPNADHTGTRGLPRQIIRTVRAGDAYLSQSSKTLLCSVPAGTELGEIVVRWPNGSVQSFAPLRPGQRYQLIEGAVQAQVLPLPTPGPDACWRQDRRSATEATTPGGPLRTTLVNPIPMPLIDYSPWPIPPPPHLPHSRTHPSSTPRSGDSGAPANSEPVRWQVNGRPTLVLLWASWCAPCIEELSHLAAARQRIANVDVLALSVDGRDSQRPTTVADAIRVVRREQWPFSFGSASDSLLDKLDLLDELLLHFDEPLQVPSAYLLDGQGYLSTIYRGPVSVEQIIADIQWLGKPPAERRRGATPFAGRWLNPTRDVQLTRLAIWYRDHDFREDFAHVLREDARRWQQRLADHRGSTWSQTFRDQFVAAQRRAAQQSLKEDPPDVDAAIAFLEQALRFAADDPATQINLAALYAKSNRLDEAGQYLRRVLRNSPGNVLAHVNLASLLEQQGRFQEAQEIYGRIVSRQPNDPTWLRRAAMAALRSGDFVQGAAWLERAVELDANDRQSLLRLVWLRAACPDEQVRNVERAQSMAVRVADLLGPRNPLVQDLRAVTSAAAGDYSQAERLTHDLIRRTPRTNRAFHRALQQRLARYAKHRPYVDQDGIYP